MSSLWTDLLFLHGHIHDPELARRLADTPSKSLPDLPDCKRRRTHSPLMGHGFHPDSTDGLIKVENARPRRATRPQPATGTPRPGCQKINRE